VGKVRETDSQPRPIKLMSRIVDHKKYYRRLRESGTCTHCKTRPAREGRAHCADCAVKRKARYACYSPTRRQRAEQEHQCKQCLTPLGEGYQFRFCPACLEGSGRRTKAYHQRLKQQGICRRCRKAPVKEGRASCAPCLEQHAKETQARQLRRAGAKGCSKCSNERLQAPLKKPLCEVCYLKQTAYSTAGSKSLWQLLKEKLEAQDYKCAYTGQRLLLGWNASLDHVLPTSLYPHLRAEPFNLVWTCRGFNTWKKNRTPEQLLELGQALVRIITQAQQAISATA
jgi:5-methylcytosine-specific restriction endonuclease McrA